MKKRICNKLVRDSVPDFIEKKGQKAEVIVLDDKRYSVELFKKLLEEVKEISEGFETEDHLKEEICDLLEIVNAIIENRKFDKEEILKLQETKRKTNGGFNKKLFLISVMEG